MAKDYYFDKEVENAIIEYNETEDDQRRSYLYRTKIDPALHKLCEITVNINNFSHFDTSKEDFIQRIKTHIVENLWRFEKDKGKAFSYFSFIARNKGIELDNKTYDAQKRDVSIDNDESTLEIQADEEDPIKSELEEFMDLFIEYWEEQMYKEFSKKRDLRVADAILDIFKKREAIDSYRKRVLYQMIRDHAGVEKAQHITKVKNKFETHYYEAIRRFKNTGSIEPEKSHDFF